MFLTFCRPLFYNYRERPNGWFNFLLKHLPFFSTAACLACFFIAMAAPSALGAALKTPSVSGSGNRGFTLGFAYDLSHLEYNETGSSDNFLDEDIAYLSGIQADARYETGSIWARAVARYSHTGWARYYGSYQDGIPLSMYTVESICQYEGDLGYKLFNISSSTITPYIGLGYRIWDRGVDALPDYREKYTWNYGSAGIDYVLRLSNLTAGADVALHIPFNMRMRTNLAGQYDETTFYLRERAGFALELPVTYEFYKYPARPVFFIYVTPYYQYWPIDASDPAVMTRVSQVNILYEPDSRTDLFGARAGIGINY